MANFEVKEGFKNITEVRNFLYGTNNRKNSKVYLNIEQIDGYNYLCIWLDNKLTLDEVCGDKKYLDAINGFKKHYQLRMNKVEEDTFLMETVQDITTIVWDAVKDNPEGTDSRMVFSECRRWAQEFEKIWQGYVEQGVEDDHDYMLEVEEFTEKKLANSTLTGIV
jgi:hypothetical protein